MNYSKAHKPSKPFWDLTAPEISQWIHALAPGIPNTGGVLFPAPPKPAAAGGDPATGAQPTPQEFAAKKALGDLLVNNLLTALSLASSFGKNMRAPEAKRQKIEHNTATHDNTNSGGGDKYNILDPSFVQSNNQKHNNNTTSELSPGAILSRITLGGLVNGMSGVEGGCVDTLSCIPLSDLKQKEEDPSAATAAKGIDAVIDTAGNLVLKDLIKLARGLLRSISAR